jgi:hypothetical protein
VCGRRTLRAVLAVGARVRVFFSMSNAPVEVRVLRYGRTYRGLGIRCASRKRMFARHGAVWARTLMIVPLGSSTKKRRTPHGSSRSA